MLSLIEYKKIKDKYCIAYFGYCREYWIILKYLRPCIEKYLPGVELYLCCRDDLLYLLEGESNVLTAEDVPTRKLRKRQFAFFNELTSGLFHPIQNLMEESNIPYPPKPHVISTPYTFSIIDHGTVPTVPLSLQQRAKAIKLAQNYGCQETNALADWVIGVESEELYDAAISGKKTSLISTGTGEELYKSLFNGEVLKF